MNPAIRLPVGFLLLLAMVMIGTGLSYQAARKGRVGPSPEGLPGPGTSFSPSLAVQRFFLGEITAPSLDEDSHFIKVEVELRFLGNLAPLLEERKWEMKELISQTLTKMTTQRARDDYSDGFLQKNLENGLNRLLRKTTEPERIDKVTIGTFLVN